MHVVSLPSAAAAAVSTSAPSSSSSSTATGALRARRRSANGSSHSSNHNNHRYHDYKNAVFYSARDTGGIRELGLERERKLWGGSGGNLLPPRGEVRTGIKGGGGGGGGATGYWAATERDAHRAQGHSGRRSLSGEPLAILNYLLDGGGGRGGDGG